MLTRADEVPIQSLEGFVRQVIGWREFVRGVYQQHSEQQDTTNFWGHERELPASWYDGTTGIPPLDDTIRDGASTWLDTSHPAADGARQPDDPVRDSAGQRASLVHGDVHRLVGMGYGP